MTAPRIEACYFTDGGKEWARFARVLAYSAQVCEGWRINVQQIHSRPIQANAKQSFKDNTRKLEHWTWTVKDASDGERIVLMDVDTMILRPLDDVWDKDFDLAYTTKPERLPFNAGVMFLRVSPRVREFMAEWFAENRRLLQQNPMKRLSHLWREQYAGINQGSLAHTLLAYADGLKIQALPCSEWNCEDASWARFDPDHTRIVHLKGTLRTACVNRAVSAGSLSPLVERWRALDAEAKRRSKAA